MNEDLRNYLKKSAVSFSYVIMASRDFRKFFFLIAESLYRGRSCIIFEQYLISHEHNVRTEIFFNNLCSRTRISQNLFLRLRTPPFWDIYPGVPSFDNDVNFTYEKPVSMICYFLQDIGVLLFHPEHFFYGNF